MQAKGKTAKCNILKERNWKREPLRSRAYGNGEIPTKRRNMGPPVTLRQSKYKGTWTQPFLFTSVMLPVTSASKDMQHSTARSADTLWPGRFRSENPAKDKRIFSSRNRLDWFWAPFGLWSMGTVVLLRGQSVWDVQLAPASSSVERKSESSCAASCGGWGKFLVF